MMDDTPRRPIKFLRWFCKADLIDEIEGDLIEAYRERCRENPKKAKRLLWLEVLESFKWKNLGIMEKQETPMQRSLAILSQYSKVFFRSVSRSKIYTSISVLSLSLGITCALLIYLYIYKEYQYDRFFTDADRIYRIAFTSESTQRTYGFAPLALTPFMVENYDGVQNGVRIFKYRREIPVTVNTSNVSYNVGKFGWADPTFFDIFDIEILRGNAENPFGRPKTLAISESTARKYFGEENPIGKIIQFNWTVPYDLEVTAVFKDFPSHSHLDFDILSSMETCQEVMWPRQQINSWQNLFTAGYIKLNEGVSPVYINEQIQQATNENFQPGRPVRINSFLQPITQIHLTSDLDLGEWKPNNSWDRLVLFGLIGIIILGLGSFNFMNMVTAQAGQRVKEIGIRKVFGGTRRSIIEQTYFETLLYVMLSLVLSGILIFLSIPLLENLTNHEYVIPEFVNLTFLLPVALLLLFIIILSGFYPALFYSGIKTIKLINRQIFGSAGKPLRNVLVLSQFTISIGLLICTLIIHHQLKFMKEKDVGFDKSLIVNIPIHNDEAVIPKLETWKAEAMNHPDVESITSASHEMFADYTYISLFSLSGQEEEHTWERYTVDEDYLKTFQLELVAGRGFSKEINTDTSAFILNESAVKALHMTPEEVVGKTMNNVSDEVAGKVVGVVRDFHFRSLHNDIKPFILHVNRERLDYISIRLSGKNFKESIIHAEESWENIMGEDIPFFYSFLDQQAAMLYKREENESRFFSLLSLVSLSLGCLGLFGLALFTTQKKVKEIGIRKVLGAGVMNILLLINSKFLKMIGLAFLVAAPIAYVLMKKWLSGYAYRIDQPVWIYILTGIMTFFISMLTVSYLSMRAAASNPVESIRNE